MYDRVELGRKGCKEWQALLIYDDTIKGRVFIGEG